MTEPIDFDDLPGSERARKFEGGGHGAGVSFFLSRHAPGEGPVLHRHPYEETFICQAGTCTFTVGDQQITAEPGHVVIVPPNRAASARRNASARAGCVISTMMLPPRSKGDRGVAIRSR